MIEQSDQQLIAAALGGAVEAFDDLVRRYQDRLVHSLEHSVCSREDALDAAQRAFLQAWRQLSKFRGESSFYSWLYRIARNEVISEGRRHRPAVSLEQLTESGVSELVDGSRSAVPGAGLELSEELASLRQAMAQSGGEDDLGNSTGPSETTKMTTTQTGEESQATNATA